MPEMTFLEHLGELRRRLVYSVLAVLAASALVYVISLPDLIVNHIRTHVLEDLTLYAFTFSEAIMLKLKLSLVLGIILCLPFLFYELWAFVSPGLTENERRKTALLITPSLLLFLVGALFAYGAVIPPLIHFLLSQTQGIAETRIQITRALEFVGVIVLLGGIVFQLPAIMVILTRMRVADWRFFVKNARYFLFLFIVAEIILTDVSAIIQIVVAFLVLCAYACGVLLSLTSGRR
jgi:sec-independent protein translocase protein TatC